MTVLHSILITAGSQYYFGYRFQFAFRHIRWFTMSSDVKILLLHHFFLHPFPTSLLFLPSSVRVNINFLRPSFYPTRDTFQNTVFHTLQNLFPFFLSLLHFLLLIFQMFLQIFSRNPFLYSIAFFFNL